MRKSCLYVFLCGVLVCFWGGDNRAELTKYTLSGYAQGTNYTVTYYGLDSVVSKKQIDSVIAVIDTSMSLYLPGSLINTINDGGEGHYVVDEHFRAVIEKSFEIYQASGGIFDITVAPLVDLWGFGPAGPKHFPDSAEVREALAQVGMDKIRLDGSTLEKVQPGVRLDVNGIAQGYTVDVLADLLEQNGVIHYLAELGGELRIKGPKPDGTPMRIGIERPATDKTGRIVINDVIELRDGAVTTAGNYRKFLQEGGKTVSHHIDPQTGYPFDTSIISATIYAKDAMTADGYDNVIMAMGTTDALRFVEQQLDMEVFIIYKDELGKTRDTMSTGFKQWIAN